MLGDDASLEPLKTLLIERTEGNPFFLEESVRTLVESQVLVGGPGTYRLVQALPSIQVPATVQAVLAARIDRLPQDDKRLLQTASVIGTEVPFSLLRTIADVPDDALHNGLIHLQTAEFLYETSLFPERIYTFKHALTHEVAYDSLLQERRRVLQARIVEALESLSGDRLDDLVERLAHHASRGQAWDKALVYCRQAGRKASARAASHEAISYLENALQALQHIPESRETLAQTIDLRFDLRREFLALSSFDQIHELLRTTEQLAETLGDPRRQGRVLLYLTGYYRINGNYDQAIEAGQRALVIAEAQDDLSLKVETWLYVAGTLYSGILWAGHGCHPTSSDSA